MQVREFGRYRQVTASGQLVPRNGTILGFMATTAGTVQITEGVAAGGSDILSSLTVVAGQYYPLGYQCPTGAYVVIGGGAVVTFVL